MRRFWFHKDEEVRPGALINVIKREPKDEALEKKPPRVREGALPRGIIWGIAGLAALFVTGFVVSFYVVRGQVAVTVSKDIDTLQSGVQDLQNLDPQSAAQKFASLKTVSPTDFGSMFNAFGFLFQGSGEAISSFADLATRLTDFSGEMNSLTGSAFGFFVNGNGTRFIADLTRLRDTIAALNDASGKLSSAAAFAGNPSPASANGVYLSLISQIQSAKTFLDAFIPWLSQPEPHHVLVLFQNPSEIRPAGGFLGSYADVTIASGSVTNVDVHDVNDVDLAFTPKIIPPKPLQLSVSKWRPADANWFFDFPTSASETDTFFEASDLYAKSSTTFDGVIAVSPKVVSDLLAIVGPIAVGKPTTTFTADNLLVETQKSVQAGQATLATYPKQVLRDLSLALFAKLQVATSSDVQALFGTALDWIAKKDIMVYMKDPAMESFAEQYGAAGDVYDLPQKFNGDYFALVDANVGGGKSDLYVSSTVSYVGQIGADGMFTGHVVVTRKHNGNQSPYWWYKTTSQDYMELFVPDGSAIANASGGLQKKITAPLNYAKSGYSTDPLIAALEATEQTLYAYPGVAWHAESGKRVFTTWSTVKAGATTQFALDYTHRLFVPPADGVTYQFVFEKQAGTRRHYSIEIDAPLGYVFAENGIAAFTYESDDLPGRLVFNLTLQKL